MKKIFRGLKWIDDHLLKILLIFFFIFIPLYPKLPLIDIEYTYIYIRIEDFFVALIYLVFFLQLLRKKIAFDKKYFIFFSLFWLSVFLSFFYGHYYLKTITVNYIGLLHSLRRIEYMGIFFVAAASVKSKKDLFYFLKVIFLTFLAVTIYGIGQKFFGWPAVQTMNPEYAKGYFLYLSPEARISSTFSGHYDLASYLIFLFPLILSFYILSNQRRYLFLFILGLINLVLTASRISYIGYILTVFPFLIYLRRFKLLILIALLTVIFTISNQNLTSRLKRTFQIKRILVDQQTGAVYIPQKITTKELPAGSFYIALNNQRKNNEEELKKFKEKVILEKQIQAAKSGKEADLASLEANLKPVSTVVSDISFATRLQIEWPRAINSLKKSPILGTGPSSLTEATDNDYLRWLGETGISGTTLFLLILLSLAKPFYFFAKRIKLKKIDEKIVYLGLLFGIIALMINASYIDVFEASKVAFIFWAMMGVFYGYLKAKKVYEK